MKSVKETDDTVKKNSCYFTIIKIKINQNK